MGLNISKGNMYSHVTHTWNTVKGECYHDCVYCYMKRWGKLNPIRFDRSELKTDLGSGNFIFVGSSNDMFAETIPFDWITDTLDHCFKFSGNRYLFQSKNPSRLSVLETDLVNADPSKIVVCTTIESNRFYKDYMCNAPHPHIRAEAMSTLTFGVSRHVTIEPVIDFDLDIMVELIRQCAPEQVNIGADSGGNGLDEPNPEKLQALIDILSSFTYIARKSNLERILAK